jgi:hypothetical protein
MFKTVRMCTARRGSGMARLGFAMNQSLDGYVGHTAFAPSPTLFRHFIEEVQGQVSVFCRFLSSAFGHIFAPVISVI